MSKRLKWVVEIEVDETWVADGFEFTEERVLAMIDSALPFAESHEITVKVLDAPERKTIRELQGYRAA